MNQPMLFTQFKASRAQLSGPPLLHLVIVLLLLERGFASLSRSVWQSLLCDDCVVCQSNAGGARLLWLQIFGSKNEL